MTKYEEFQARRAKLRASLKDAEDRLKQAHDRLCRAQGSSEQFRASIQVAVLRTQRNSWQHQLCILGREYRALHQPKGWEAYFVEACREALPEPHFKRLLAEAHERARAEENKE